MARIHNTTNDQDKYALLKKTGRNGTDEEGGKGEHLSIAQNSQNSKQASTDLSSDIGGDLFIGNSNSSSSNNNSNRRKRSWALSILRIIFVMVILTLCVVTTVFISRIVGNSRKGDLDENDNDVVGLIGNADSDMPPSSNNSTVETTTTSTVVPENNPAIDELIQDEADAGDNNYSDTGGNLTADEDEELDAGMAIIEVTERRITPMEINGGGAVDVETLSKARAAPILVHDKQHAESHGIHKQRRLDNSLADYAASCDPCQYYGDSEDASFWTRDALQSFLESTEQRNLTYTEIWSALEDLDRGDTARTVRTIYTNQTIFSNLKVFGSLQSGRWNREHLWPCSRGVRCGRNGVPQGPDYTDIHHLFPSNYDGNAARGNKYFDYCNDADVCKVPLKLKGENIPDPPLCFGETCSDFSKIFQPPEAVRGLVARAIFYMDLRYPHLQLADSPNDDQMGNLSTLLEWHKSYPPEPREIQRNDGACSRWQGNRNPFVDFPDLVEIIYGDSTIDDVGNPFRGCRETSTAKTINNEVTDSPTDISTDVPIDVSTDVPKNISTDVPTDISSNATTEFSSDVPSDISIVDNESSPNNSTENTATVKETIAPLAPVTYPTGFSGGSTAAAISSNIGLDDIYNSFKETTYGSIFLPQPGDVMIVGLNSDDPDLFALVALEDLAEGLIIHVTDNAFDKESRRFKTNEGTKSLTLNEPIKSGTVFGFGDGMKYSAFWVDGPSFNFDLSTKGDTIVVYASTIFDPDKQVMLSAISFADNDVLCDIPDSISDYTLALGREENYIFDGDKDAPKIKFQRQLLDKNFWVGSDEKLEVKLKVWTPLDKFQWIFPGEVMIIGVHSGNNIGGDENPDIVALLALNDLPKNAVIRMTDNAYNINTKTFNSGEGTLRFILPEIIPAGTVFGYGGDLLYGDMWENEVDKRFELTVSGEKVPAQKDKNIIVRGDTVLVYVTTTRDPDDWTILSLVAFAGSGLPQADLNSKYSIRLGNEYNFIYTGDTTGSRLNLQNELVDVNNWEGSFTQEDVMMTHWQPPNQHVFEIAESPLSLERASGAGRTQLWPVQVILLFSCLYLFV